MPLRDQKQERTPLGTLTMTQLANQRVVLGRQPRTVPKPTALYFQGVRQHFAMQVMACKMDFINSDAVMEANGSHLFDEYSKDAQGRCGGEAEQENPAPDTAQWDAWIMRRFVAMAGGNKGDGV